MKICLNQISKRYIDEWVFRDINATIETNSFCAITGNNGSGKSTLLQIISGYQTPTKGNLSWELNNQSVSVEKIFKQISIAAPYLGLFEEYSFKELFLLQQKLKPFTNNNFLEVAKAVALESAINKPIKAYSSGMKQRTQLALAFFAATPLLLLDEPTANLDEAGIEIYNKLLAENLGQRTIVIASNIKEEYKRATQIVTL
jgi:ABC-type multidrug transport system ATPase subunit